MITRAIIVAGGMGTRFLPGTMAVPKEMFYLVDRPVLHYILDEVIGAGVEEICIVTSPEKEKALRAYFDRDSERDDMFIKKDRHGLVDALCKTTGRMKISYALQEKPLGNGDAILRAPEEFKKEPCGILFGDDLWTGSRPALSQLIEAYEKVQSPVIALSRIPEERVQEYGIVAPENIVGRLVKLRDIIEKPKREEAPSNLAVVGKYVVTPKVFERLKHTRPDVRGEIQIAETFHNMLTEGKNVYGYELEGEWIPCGDRLDFLKSTVKLASAHPELGKEFQEFLKDFTNKQQ